MGKIAVLMALLGALGGDTATHAGAIHGAEACVIKVEGMACGACAARVEREVKKIDGVASAKVNQPKGVVKITYDPAKTSPDKLAQAITKKTGFAATPAKE